MLYVEIEPKKLEALRAQFNPTTQPEMGESTYMAWLAMKMGIPVKTWDVPYVDQMKAAMTKYPPEAVIGSSIGQGLIHVIRNETQSGNKIPRSEALRNTLVQGLGAEVLDFIEKDLKIPFNDETIRGIIKSYSSLDLDTMTQEQASDFMRPDGQGIVNQANAAATRSRDENAIREIYTSKNEGKNVEIIAGSAHAKLWEGPLRKIYSDPIQPTQPNGFESGQPVS